MIVPIALDYTLGDPTLQGGLYGFTSSGDGPGQKEMIIKDLPDFVEHD